MTMLINQLRMLAKDESGQDLLEYALLVALIALVAFGAVAAAGTPGEHDLHQHREPAEDHVGIRFR